MTPRWTSSLTCSTVYEADARVVGLRRKWANGAPLADLAPDLAPDLAACFGRGKGRGR